MSQRYSYTLTLTVDAVSNSCVHRFALSSYQLKTCPSRIGLYSRVVSEPYIPFGRVWRFFYLAALRVPPLHRPILRASRSSTTRGGGDEPFTPPLRSARGACVLTATDSRGKLLRELVVVARFVAETAALNESDCLSLTKKNEREAVASLDSRYLA